MSDLRRRFGHKLETPLPEPTVTRRASDPALGSPPALTEAEEVKARNERDRSELDFIKESVKEVKHVYHTRHQRKPSKRRGTFLVLLGALLGFLAAGYLANQQGVINLEQLLDINLDHLIDVIPAGVLRDARELQRQERETVSYDSFAVGLHLRSQNISAVHPVFMVPGVISTGLESWGTDEEGSRQYFRKRLWGSWSMMRALIMDKPGWKRHIMLDKTTGLDPPGVKLRAAQGFDAADFFITGYWIWNKILENLATIGYDPTNSYTAAYDWRLSYANLEIRDQYFSRLKVYIEMAVRSSGKKVVLASHSMGSQVMFYFFAWVESPEHGKGGRDWVDTFIDSWINISGCMLGAVKGIPAVLSGEMKDTAQLNAFAVYGLEKFLAKEERVEIFRAMPGISSMLPKGGDLVWGNATWAPDDLQGQKNSFGHFLSFLPLNATAATPNMTVDQTIEYLRATSDDWYVKQLDRSYSHGVAHTSEQVEKNMADDTKWINPLEARLPIAPNLKIFCFYGVGKPTERSYYYRDISDNPLTALNASIDTGFSHEEVDHGVIMGEGDGTVNLLSSGYMCAKGWHIRRYNPAGIKITTYEMPHEPDRFSPRGGPNTGDHVDILGRASLNDLILRVAGGKGSLIRDHFVSPIREYAEKVKIYEEERYLSRRDDQAANLEEARVSDIQRWVTP